MQCSFCGGEINLTVGRCTKCGRAIDESADVRLTRSIEELAEQYGIKSKEEKKAEEEALPPLLRNSGYVPDDEEEEPRDTGIITHNGPVLSKEDYERLLSQDAEDEEEIDRDYLDIRAERIKQSSPLSVLNGAIETARSKIMAPLDDFSDRAKETLKAWFRIPAIQKLWSLSGERLVSLYNEHFPELKRVKQSTRKQRIYAAIALCLVFIAAVMLIVSLASSIAPGIKGEWLITETASGEKLTWEFTGSGKVIVRTYTGGQPHIYRTGSYKKRRRNDHNLLTITYEDGDVTRLYYEVSRGVGTFTNVDSNQTAQYKRIRR